MGAVQEANKVLIRRWIGPADEQPGPFLLSDGALDVLMEDAVWHLPPTAEIPGVEDPRLVRGREAIHAIQTRAGEIYDVSTIEVEIRNLLADGDWVVLQYLMRCRAVNGNPYEQEYLFLFEIHDGRIATIWDYYDTLQVARLVL